MSAPTSTAELRELLEDVARQSIDAAIRGRRTWRDGGRRSDGIFDLDAELARDPIGAADGVVLDFGPAALSLATRPTEALRGETDRPLPPELRRTHFVTYLSAAGVRSLGLTRDGVLAVARLRTMGGVGLRPTWREFAKDLAALIGTRPDHLMPVLEGLGFELPAELPDAAPAA